MAGRRKKAFGVEVVPQAKLRDITLEQYTKGFQVFSTSGSVPEVLAATGMTRKQFEYLLSNPLPGHPSDKHPSYYARFSEISLEMRSNAVEAAQIISKGGVRNLRTRDKLAVMAELMVHTLMENRARGLLANAKLDPNSVEWKPNHKLTFTTAETSMLKVLYKFMDYSKMGDAFERVYERGGASAPGRLPKGAKVDFNIDPETVLPAVVSTQPAVVAAQEQESEDFHQQLFRDFEAWSEEELEAYMSSGDMPASEKFTPGSGDE